MKVLVPVKLSGRSDRQVVAPEVYVAVGISGAIQHPARLDQQGRGPPICHVVPELTAKL